MSRKRYWKSMKITWNTSLGPLGALGASGASVVFEGDASRRISRVLNRRAVVIRESLRSEHNSLCIAVPPVYPSGHSPCPYCRASCLYCSFARASNSGLKLETFDASESFRSIWGSCAIPTLPLRRLQQQHTVDIEYCIVLYCIVLCI